MLSGFRISLASSLHHSSLNPQAAGILAKYTSPLYSAEGSPLPAHESAVLSPMQLMPGLRAVGYSEEGSYPAVKLLMMAQLPSRSWLTSALLLHLLHLHPVAILTTKASLMIFSTTVFS